MDWEDICLPGWLDSFLGLRVDLLLGACMALKAANRLN